MRRGIAALQMSSTANRAENLQCAEILIASAARQGAQLLVLPENFALLGAEGVYQVGLSETQNCDDHTLRKWMAAMGSDRM